MTTQGIGDGWPSPASIVYLNTPIALHEELALEYGFNYEQPLRHFRLNSAALSLMSDAVRGRYGRMSFLPIESIRKLPGMTSGPIPSDLAGSPIDSMILDGSIGGPSMWGGHVARREWSGGRRCLYVSFSRAEALFAGVAIDLPKPWTKFVFTHWARALVQTLKPSRLLVVGREVAAHFFDLFFDISTTVVETGFAESSLITTPVPPDVLQRSLVELLFRAATFPWDSLAHALAGAASIRAAESNVLWSERVYSTLKDAFPDAVLRFVPPSVDTVMFAGTMAPLGRPLRVLLGGGAHPLGGGGRDFLSILPLVEAARRIEGCRVSILTADTARLEAALGDQPHVEILPRVPWDQMPGVFARHNVYYRVQNDASLPTSCLEAMAQGLPTIANRRAREAFNALEPGKNVLLVPFADTSAVHEALSILHSDEALCRRIGSEGSKLVRDRCDLDANLHAIGWSP